MQHNCNSTELHPERSTENSIAFRPCKLRYRYNLGTSARNRFLSSLGSIITFFFRRTAWESKAQAAKRFCWWMQHLRWIHNEASLKNWLPCSIVYSSSQYQALIHLLIKIILESLEIQWSSLCRPFLVTSFHKQLYFFLEKLFLSVKLFTNGVNGVAKSAPSACFL